MQFLKDSTLDTMIECLHSYIKSVLVNYFILHVCISFNNYKNVW